MLKSKSFYILLGAIIYPLLFQSCTEDVGGKLGISSSAFGKASEIAVIADQELWEGAVGDTFRQYFGSAYLILPQPEPIYDIRHYTPNDLAEKSPRKELRTYVLLGNLGDSESPTTRLISKDIGTENVEKALRGEGYNTKVGRDKWARGQLLIYLFSNNNTGLAETIKKNFPAASKRINDADLKQLEANTYQSGEATALRGDIKEHFGIDIHLPGDYISALSMEEDVAWLRKETDVASSNIIITKLPYTDAEQLSKAGIKALRDTLGKKYVSSELEGTYMKTNNVDLPMYTKVTSVDNKYALEARGIWEIVNDFMGGPFLSYLIHDAEKNELIFIDCFVHAPGKKKRIYMQSLEIIIDSIRF